MCHVFRKWLFTILRKYSWSRRKKEKESHMSINIKINIWNFHLINWWLRLLIILMNAHISHELFFSMMRTNVFNVVILYKFRSFADFKWSIRWCQRMYKSRFFNNASLLTKNFLFELFECVWIDSCRFKLDFMSEKWCLNVYFVIVDNVKNTIWINSFLLIMILAINATSSISNVI